MANLESRVADLETRVAALEARRPALANAVASGRPAPWDLSARQPCPEVRIPATIDNVIGAMRIMGWDRFPERASLHDALAYGVTEAMLVAHFAAILAKYPSAAEAAQAGHGANLRLHKTAYDLLIDGRGIGYTAWSATEADQRALYGYSQSDIDALSAQHPEKLIEDYWDFVESNGARGWKPRTKDAYGNWL